MAVVLAIVFRLNLVPWRRGTSHGRLGRWNTQLVNGRRGTWVDAGRWRPIAHIGFAMGQRRSCHARRDDGKVIVVEAFVVHFDTTRFGGGLLLECVQRNVCGAK